MQHSPNLLYSCLGFCVETPNQIRQLELETKKILTMKQLTIASWVQGLLIFIQPRNPLLPKNKLQISVYSHHKLPARYQSPLCKQTLKKLPSLTIPTRSKTMCCIQLGFFLAHHYAPSRNWEHTRMCHQSSTTTSPAQAHSCLKMTIFMKTSAAATLYYKSYPV